MKPLVSVIIPCYNVEDCVEQAIQSVLSQTYKPLELILVDNASTDQTWSILSSYAAQQVNISCFSEGKPGAPAARNRGLIEAKGDWIQFLDADDALLPKKIQVQQELIIHHQREAAVIIGNSLFQTLSGKRTALESDQNIWLGLLKGMLGNTCANLWSRKAILEVGGWDESYSSSQEYELLFRMLKQDVSVLFDSNYHTIIRQRNGSISTTNLQENEQVAAKLRIQIFQYLMREGKIAAESRNDYLQVLLQYLARLGVSDADLATKIFRMYYPQDFKVENSRMGRFYTYSFNLVGFSTTQLLYKYYIYLRAVIMGRIPCG